MDSLDKNGGQKQYTLARERYLDGLQLISTILDHHQYY
jgi:hypothetical protein